MHKQEMTIGTVIDMPHDAPPVNLNLCAAHGIFSPSKPD